MARSGSMRLVLAAMVLSGLAAATPALAQGTEAHAAHHPATAADAASMTAAVVRKIDRSAGKITLKHEPIASLDMTAMTMVFRVADPAMLDAVKVGDAVRFTAESNGGQLTVTRIEKAP